MDASPAPAPWRIAIDTGGTFTDAIALTPEGDLRTAKTLSSGALRAQVVDADGERLRIEQQWGPAGWPAPDGFIAGARARIGGRPEEAIVLGFDARASLIRLDRPLAAAPGESVEIRTGEDAPALAIRLLTQTLAGVEPPPRQVRLSTTRATNALLERRGARVGVILNAGHGDLLAIGDQRRPELFALTIRKPEPWHEQVVEVGARLDARGEELAPVDAGEVARAAESFRAAGVDSVAIALLHADVNPAHEIEIEQLLREAGFASVTRSSALAPRLGLLARAQTATIDAYIGPVLRDYLAGAAGTPTVPGGRGMTDARRPTNAVGGRGDPSRPPRSVGPPAALRIMTSAGGLSLPERFHATEGLLSGPAGGVAGALAAGRAEGEARLISFDMGGTSTDVARLDDGFEYRFEQKIAGATVLAPAIAIETVAAGGGSICALEHGRLSVGPRSAGADPGPACYGAGGPLTLTDVNLLLGRIDPGSLPIPIDPAAAEARLAELAKSIEGETGAAPDRDGLLQGLIDIADERMAGAIRSVSSRKGVDPADYTLVAFGGAGGLHACGVAQRLGITRIIVPARAGLLSASGVASAAIEEFAERQILRPLGELEGELEFLAAELAAQAGANGGGIGVSPVRGSEQDIQRLISLRMLGQESTIDLDWPADAPASTLPQRFAEAHERQYGAAPNVSRIEAVSLRVIVRDTSSAWRVARRSATGGDAERDVLSDQQRAREEGGRPPRSGGPPRLRRASLVPGATLHGPALLLESTATTWLAEGWTLRVTEHGALSLALEGGREPSSPGSAESAVLSGGAGEDRIAQELFTTRLEAIAEDMGETLRRSALSTNIRQRLDYSCAILDGEAELIISAPHVPVHLGALGECVRRVRERIEIGPGDIIITNHPAYGGSHLPDITLIAGVFAGGEQGGPPLRAGSSGKSGPAPTLDPAAAERRPTQAPVAYIACRAHHAEIGGIAPGSMPAGATTLAEEGVIIEPTHLARNGRFDWEAIGALLQGAEHPTRALEENLADLRAQVAAVRRGERATAALMEAIGAATFARRAETIKATAESLLRARLAELPPGERSAERLLDDGASIRVRIVPSTPTVPGGRTATDARPMDQARGAPGAPDDRSSSPPDSQARGLAPQVDRGGTQGEAETKRPPAPRDGGGTPSPHLTIDFTGSAPEHPGSFNATPAIVRSCLIYVLRLLVDEPIPLNEGLMRAVDLRLPPGMLNPRFGPSHTPAVSAGNVETSQAIVDALIEAFGLAAASQGTMNNLAFGPVVAGGDGAAFPSFYETLGGGSGATRDGPGASAVHTHMTNTALTDPEVIERRYPVRVERLAIRRGSGGAAGPAGYPGGDGIDRRLRFLAAGGAAVSLVTQRRTCGPAGLLEGGPGAAGRQWLEPAAGEATLPLPPVASLTVAAGDLLVIQTPGGGGCGPLLE